MTIKTFLKKHPNVSQDDDWLHLHKDNNIIFSVKISKNTSQADAMKCIEYAIDLNNLLSDKFDHFSLTEIFDYDDNYNVWIEPISKGNISISVETELISNKKLPNNYQNITIDLLPQSNNHYILLAEEYIKSPKSALTTINRLVKNLTKAIDTLST
jgi:hypothetical protein